MYRIQFDTDSPFTIRTPQQFQSNKILTLAQAFVTYEQSLPPAEQTPYIEIISNLLADLSADRSTISRGEGQRQIASEALKRADRKARQLIGQMARIVGGYLYNTPHEAHEWGFRVRQSTGNLRIPQTRIERLALLEAYIAKEESRPEADRFTTPDLGKVQQVREQLAANLAARNSAQTRREKGVIARNEDSQTLMSFLHLATIHIIGMRYDFKISPDLQDWGFEVVSRSGANTESEERSEEAVVAAEVAPQEEDAASNGVVYEAEQNGTYQPEPGMSNGSA